MGSGMRNDVEHRHILRMSEGETSQLIDVGDVLGTLRERNDVATGCRYLFSRHGT